VLGVSAATPAGPRALDADFVLMATGAFLHGGLRATQSGRIVETVFDLPIESPRSRSEWVGETPLGSHPYDHYGVRVDERMQPVDSDGEPFFDNLYACGGVLGDADRFRDHSRQGIDLATAYAAVEAMAQ
jgi:glycerol-3-phosphate dehydrogenase subunit B